MRSFEAQGLNPAQFVEKIEDALAERGYDRYVSIHLNGDRLKVELRWMGTTRFEYLVIPRGEGFTAELVGQRVAPLHAAFSDRFEGYFEQALDKVGATTI